MSSNFKAPQIVQDAFSLAQKARQNAYAEYSKVKVGAAVKARGSAEIFYGSNVEIVVNGASVCAERSAVSDMVSNLGGKPQLEFVVVCSNTKPALYPCGVCLQVMSEFCSPELDIYIGDKDQILEKAKLKELLPHQYSELPKVLDE
ncbi:MAG: cytidine deaminase [Bacteriovoracaceae bacterium]